MLILSRLPQVELLNGPLARAFRFNAVNFVNLENLDAKRREKLTADDIWGSL